MRQVPAEQQGNGNSFDLVHLCATFSASPFVTSFAQVSYLSPDPWQDLHTCLILAELLAVYGPAPCHLEATQARFQCFDKAEGIFWHHHAHVSIKHTAADHVASGPSTRVTLACRKVQVHQLSLSLCLL